MRRRGAAALAMLGMVLILSSRNAEAQVVVRLTGDLEVGVGQDVTHTGGQKSSSTIEWGIQALPTLDGFVIDPRFVSFSLTGGYQRYDADALRGATSVAQWDQYRLDVNFFSQARHSFELLAVRTVIDRTFSTDSSPLTSALSEMREGESLTWRYRGSARLPDASVELRREKIREETIDGDFTQNLWTLDARAWKTLPRSQPQVTYILQHREVEGTRPVFQSPLNTGEGFSQSIQYDDQIRVGASALLVPLVSYLRGPDGSQSAVASLRLTAPLSPTLDSTSSVRYGFTEFAGASGSHTLAADSVMTKRMSPTFTLTGGATAVGVAADGFSWSAVAFGSASATPWTNLQAAADASVQLTGDDRGVGYAYRAHVGAVSTHVPAHTLNLDYYLNLAENPEDVPSFTSHDASLAITSLVIPWTTITARYNVNLQEGLGEQFLQSGTLSATVTPGSRLSATVGGGVYTKSSTGGGRGPIDETGWGVDGGITVSPTVWLTLTLSGRHVIQDIDSAGERTRYVNDVARGTAAVTLGAFEATAEAFAEREPAIELTRYGVRGSMSYRFRVWRLGLDFERSQFTIAGVESDRYRFLVRIARTMNGVWRF